VIIPAWMLACCAAPVILPGQDAAQLISIQAVVFGLTLRSAMRVRRAGS
jgi:hypothetical protein